MIDDELLVAIRNRSRAFGLEELAEADAQDFLREISERFRINSNERWWWASIEDAQAIEYTDDDDFASLLELIPVETEVCFVPTDDEFAPWPVLVGEVGALVELLRQMHFFEYFVAARDGAWIVFDTHENSLITAGNLQPPLG